MEEVPILFQMTVTFMATHIARLKCSLLATSEFPQIIIIIVRPSIREILDELDLFSFSIFLHN